MRAGLLSLLLLVGIISCTPDERVIPIVGVYRAHIVGVAGPFDLIVSTHQGDNLLIEAPFDGDQWAIIEVDVDRHYQEVVDIDVLKQDIYNGQSIHGDGFFSNNTMELEYCIRENGSCQWYTLVASKL